MSLIDDALSSLEAIEDGTERALQLAGLVSTLFKIRGVVLIVTGQSAFDSYANTLSEHPELELAAFAGKLTPRMLQEIMGGQLRGEGSIYRWKVTGIPVRFQDDVSFTLRELCRDYMTDHGVVKLFPAEEITAQRILAAVYPVPNAVAEQEARLLLINGLTDAFKMDWTALRNLCHQPEYRIGEELAQMRAAAKQEADALGITVDPTGQPSMPPPPPAVSPELSPEPAEGTGIPPEISSEQSPPELPPA